MINWNEYKKYKVAAEQMLDNRNELPANVDLRIAVLEFRLNRKSKEQSIEILINFLSNGEHFKNNKFYL